MKKVVLGGIALLVLLSILVCAGACNNKAWQDSYAYDQFEINGREGIMVKPKHPNGKWVIRPAFVGAFPYVDDSLLARGYHVGYYDLTHEYGNIKAQKDFKEYVYYC